MKLPRFLTTTAAVEPAAGAALDRTVRIEHDRRRLALRALLGTLALLVLCASIAGAVLNRTRMWQGQSIPPELDTLLRITAVSWWTTVALAIAVVTGAIGVLRNIYRLQDADPALVISPRGLNFRPTVFAETARIPWSAIRGVRLRRHKHQRWVAVAVDGVDRYVAQAGLRARLHNLFRNRAQAPEVLFSTPMAPAAWARLEQLLKEYLARYGQPGTNGGGEPPAAGPPRPH